MTRVLSCSPDQALSAALRRMVPPFDVADRDCCRTAGRAFADLWGINPIINATYRTHREALKYLKAYGGAQACHEVLARRAGLVAADPAPGLIGSVSVTVGPLPWALGLCIDGTDWAVMGKEGLIITKAPAQAWGVPWA